MTEFFLRAFINSTLALWFFAIIKFRKDESVKTRHFRSLTFAVISFVATYFMLERIETVPKFADSQSDYLIGLITVIIVGWFLFYFIEWVRANLEEGPPYFKLFGGFKLIPFDRRVALIFAVWILTLLLTAYILTAHRVWPDLLGESFVTSWLGDVAFFSLVGIAVALAGIRLPHTEAFDTRLSILFSGNKSEAMKSTRDRVRALGFYVSAVKWEAFIKEYSEEYDAVKVEVEVTSTLENLFGDVDAEDKMKIELTPDSFTDNIPSPIGRMESMFVDTDDISVRRMQAPVEIKQEGIVINEKFTVKDKPVNIRYKYWLWVKIGEVWSHKPNRYTESANAVITNNIAGGSLGVEIERLNVSDGSLAKKLLRYGDRCEIPEERSMEWGTPCPLFKIHRPGEIDDDCP